MELLLQNHKMGGYPTEYLISRIRGKRASMIRDWKTLINSTNPIEPLISTKYREVQTGDSLSKIWIEFLKEIRWVYFQMNARLRSLFQPFFLYHELRTLLFCLRFKQKKGNEEKTERLLSYSILSERVKEIVLTGDTVIDVLAGLDPFFVSLSVRFQGIEEVSGRDGIRDLEQKLMDRYLEHAVRAKAHPLIKRFFIYCIDVRNILAVYKYLKWDISDTPSLVNGGSLGKKKLKQVIAERDISAIDDLIYKITGSTIEAPTASHVENTLYKGVTRFLRTAGREPLGIGLILDYLWRCSLETRNLMIILAGRGIDREALAGEMIS